MPRFAANLSLMFREAPFLDRFGRARDAGFEAVECQFPYDHPAPAVDVRLREHGLRMVLINAPPGEAGEMGTTALPGRRAAFRDGVRQALDYAGTIGCPRLHLLAGLAPPGAAADTLTATMAANLDWAAEQCAPAGIKPLIEPINSRDMPGYALRSTDQAAAIIEAVGPERVGMQFDLYHCQISEGDLVRRFGRHLPLIAHAQVADTPGRHEPGTGEVRWPFVFERLDAMGYRGWIGCEYHPAGDTEAGLGRFAPYARRPVADGPAAG